MTTLYYIISRSELCLQKTSGLCARVTRVFTLSWQRKQHLLRSQWFSMRQEYDKDAVSRCRRRGDQRTTLPLKYHDGISGNSGEAEPGRRGRADHSTPTDWAGCEHHRQWKRMVMRWDNAAATNTGSRTASCRACWSCATTTRCAPQIDKAARSDAAAARATTRKAVRPGSAA